jgi:endonuclease/exonuclease/phosphatase family metal-dependent hydrolase
VHLSLVRDERASHLSDVLRDHVPSTRTVVLGDLNELPGGPTWTTLSGVLVDADPEGDPTFPAVDALHRIDAIFTSRDLSVGPARVLADPPALRGSDHRPLVAGVGLPV